MKKTLKYVLATATLVAGLGSLASCKGYEWVDDGKQYTYNTYTSVSPSNWNELTYQDNNDTQIMSYIGSSFFGYDFKFDSNGMIVPGEFTVTYEAATALEVGKFVLSTKCKCHCCRLAIGYKQIVAFYCCTLSVYTGKRHILYYTVCYL